MNGLKELAEECGWEQGNTWDDCMCCGTFDIEAFAKLVAAKEREACVIAGFHACLSQDDAVRVREAIRARDEA